MNDVSRRRPFARFVGEGSIRGPGRAPALGRGGRRDLFSSAGENKREKGVRLEVAGGLGGGDGTAERSVDSVP